MANACRKNGLFEVGLARMQIGEKICAKGGKNDSAIFNAGKFIRANAPRHRFQKTEDHRAISTSVIFAPGINGRLLTVARNSLTVSMRDCS